MRELERIAELRVLYAVARMVHATQSPLGLPPNPGVAEHFRGILEGGLGALDDLLSDGRLFVAGDRPTIADCTLEAAFQFGRFGGVDLAPSFIHLAHWDQAYRDRPAAKSVLVA